MLRIERDLVAGRIDHSLTTDACMSVERAASKSVLPSDVQPVPGTYPLVKGFAPGTEVLGAARLSAAYYGSGGTPAQSTKERVRSRSWRWTGPCTCMCVCVYVYACACVHGYKKRRVKRAEPAVLLEGFATTSQLPAHQSETPSCPPSRFSCLPPMSPTWPRCSLVTLWPPCPQLPAIGLVNNAR